jgi:hypothetical protein
MSKEAMKLAQEIAAQYNKAERFQTWTHDFMMQRLMELVTISAADEREACAQSLDKQADLACDAFDRKWAQEMAAAVRARRNT